MHQILVWEQFKTKNLLNWFCFIFTQFKYFLKPKINQFYNITLIIQEQTNGSRLLQRRNQK